MSCAIVILNYNDCITTKSYIERIKDYDCLERIIVVDNCSKDNSFNELIKFKNYKTEIIQTDKNGGYAYGNNYGVNFIISNYPNIDTIIISNPDIIISEDVIKSCMKIFDLDPCTFAVSPYMCDINNTEMRNFAWRTLKYTDALLSNTVFLQAFLRNIFHVSKFYQNKQKDENGFMVVDNLPGSYFIANVNKWKDLCGFDESTFLYFEEDIIFYKAKCRGYRSYVNLNEKYIHMEGVSINKSIKSFFAKEAIYRTSCCVYLKKYLGVNCFQLLLYKFLNYFFLPSRYFYNISKRRRANHDTF